MTKSRIRKTAAAAISIMLMLAMLLGGSACKASQDIDYSRQADGIVSYIKAFGGEEDSGCFIGSDCYRAGDAVSDWIIVMLAKMNKEDDYTKYLSDIDEYITECYRTDEQLDRIKATEWQRIALAVAAAGGDPEAIGSDRNGSPVNLMADGVYDWKHTKSIDMQGCNGIIYGLIALDSINCKVPEKAVYTRDKLINMLLDYQSGDGSFSLSREGSGDTDITAMALQALAPYATDGTPASEIKAETRAKAESATGKALKYLAAALGDNGMYAYDGECSSETSSQVIMALCAMGIDPKESGDFTKSGVSIVDGMMNFRMDNGGFSHSEAADADESGDNIMSSQQAGCAFVSLMLMQNGEGGFFSFADR